MLIDKVEKMQGKAGLRSLAGAIAALSLVMALSACSPVAAMKSTYEGAPFPAMPAPQVVTYVLDLSGSTFPTAQLQALGSGISDFLAGDSLGDPFAATPIAPRGLSIQFVTQNSAQAPRILLVSTRTSKALYDFLSENSPNLEGARQLWKGLMSARTQIWQNAALQADQEECITQVIRMLGRQQLLPEALKVPANTICQDAKQSAAGLKRLKNFVAAPGIQMGSDVKGAIEISLKNLISVKGDFFFAHLSLVIASDLVDEVDLDLPRRLARSDSKLACALAKQDAGKTSGDFSDVDVTIVGARNSKVNPKLLDLVHSYWTCYFNQIGISKVQEQSDLSGF